MPWEITVSYSWDGRGPNMTAKADEAMGAAGLRRIGTSLYRGEFGTEDEAKNALGEIADHVRTPGERGTIDCVSVAVVRTLIDQDQ